MSSCEISFLKYCFIVKLFKKWRICSSPLPQDGASIWRLIFAFWLLDLVTPHLGDAKFGHRSGGEGGSLGCLVLLIYMTSRLCFWCYSPLDTALLLVLLQPSGDGYFRLCSLKSSFRGTHLFQLHSCIVRVTLTLLAITGRCPVGSGIITCT
jgi:hypothetical protein